jgi:hypothetical protein
MRLLRHPRFLSALVAASALWASGSGCTKTVEHTFLVAPDGSVTELTTSGTIGSSGGMLEVTDPNDPAYGTVLTVPPDAVSMDTTVTISADATVQGTPYGTRSVGPEIKITPLDLAFNAGKVASLTLPYRLDPKQGERLVVLRRSSASGLGTMAAGSGDMPTGDWEILSSTGAGDNSRRVVVSTDRLGVFVVAVTSEGVTLPDGGDGSVPLPDSLNGGDSTGGDGPNTGNDQRPPVFAGLDLFQFTDDGNGGVNADLSWMAATDDHSPQDQIRYRLYEPSFATVGTPQMETAPGATSLSLPVVRGVTYYFLVRAVDLAGNEDSNLHILSMTAPTGAVLAKLGDPCTQGTDCQSTFCADGVCCDGACDTTCSYCKTQGNEGRCKAATAGTDPRSECQSPGTGATGLCGADQTCSLCAATSNGEICNNGIDDNGDNLADAQDPQCEVCLGKVVCVSEPARFFPTRQVAIDYSQRITSMAVDDRGTLGLGVQDSSTGPTLPDLQRFSQATGFVDDLDLESSTNLKGSTIPIVVRGNGQWVGFFQDYDTTTSQNNIYAVTVSDAGQLGTPVIVVDGSVGQLNEYNAVATKAGFAVIYSHADANFNEVLDVATLTPTLTAGHVINLVPASSTGSFANLRIVDDRAASQIVAVWRFNTPAAGPMLQGARAAYTATSATATTLDLGTVSAGSIFGFDLALAGASATANPIILAFSYQDVNTYLLLGTQRYGGDFSLSGAQNTVNYFLSGSNAGDVRVASHPGQDVAVIWEIYTPQSSYAQVWLTRLNPSDGTELSTFPLGNANYSLQQSQGLGGLVASSINFAAGLNLASEFTGTAALSLCDPATPPGNDTCAKAFPIAVDETQFGNTGSAADDGPLGTCTGTGRDVYYTVTTQFAAQVVVSSSYGAIVAIDVADACQPTTCSSTDNPTAGLPPPGYASYFLNGAGTYVLRVRVTAANGGGTDYSITVNNAS